MNQNQFQAPQLRAYKDGVWGDRVRFVCRKVNPDGTIMRGIPIHFEHYTMEAVEHPPILTLSPEAAQVLMDDLWQCGLRPTEGKGSAGQLAATEAHLKDMQTISFKFIKKAKL